MIAALMRSSDDKNEAGGSEFRPREGSDETGDSQAVVSWCHRYTLFSGCEWLDLASEKSGLLTAYTAHI